jgi:hypothetical protein
MMKWVKSLYCSTASIMALLLIGCTPQEVVTETCPECWDEKMECKDFKCECPEASIPTWLELHSFDEPLRDRKYCIIPSKLTFKADINAFECIDTFAITFLTEPLEVDRSTPILDVSSVIPEVPDRWKALPPALSLNVAEEAYPEVIITNLYPTRGTSFMSCMSYTPSGELEGRISNINFYGQFIHKDTIGGFLQLEGASGIYSSLEGSRKEIKLVRTVSY